MNLVFSGTTQIATSIRQKEVSAVEVLEAHLAQIERHNPALNAVVILEAEQALERARAADKALARGEDWGPLHGVPFTLKDAHSTQGMRTTVGFPPLADHVPQQDSTVAARLKAAGAILIGKTNVATMLGDFQSSNPIFGRTNNPWDPARTPGGSSGGAAAALASGMTPFEFGTDLAGSIRIPAHFCGVFGFKPTENRISTAGLIPNPQGLPRAIRIMSCIGPMARTVEDLALLYALVAGPDNRDTEIAPAPVHAAYPPKVKELRIAVAPTLAGLPVAAEIRDAITRLARELEPLCAVVEEPALPPVDFEQDLAQTGALIGMMLSATEPQAHGEAVTLAQYLAALHRRDQSIIAWEEFFETWDVLICPPAMTTAFPHCEPGTPLEVDGESIPYAAVNAHTALFNYSGHPTLVLPYARDRDGLPLGIQIVGKRGDDARLLAIAEALTTVTGVFQIPSEQLARLEQETSRVH